MRPREVAAGVFEIAMLTSALLLFLGLAVIGLGLGWIRSGGGGEARTEIRTGL